MSTNLKTIRTMAWSYNAANGGMLPLDELVSAGNAAWAEALTQYDPARRVPFPAFVNKCILNYFGRVKIQEERHGRTPPQMNMIRAVAWSFYRTTGLNVKELTAEASLAYYEALNEWRDEAGVNCKFTTFAYRFMTNHLVSFCTREQDTGQVEVDQALYENPLKELEFQEFLSSLPRDLRLIAEMVLTDPERYNDDRPKMARGRVVADLRENMGWSWARIWDGVRNFKMALNEM